jgi:hypothetical protein
MIIAHIRHHGELLHPQGLFGLYGNATELIPICDRLGHLVPDTQVMFGINRHLGILAHVHFGALGHRATVWSSQRHLTLARAVHLLPQACIMGLTVTQLPNLLWVSVQGVVREGDPSDRPFPVF